ncbi:MAG: hypothetical protein AAF907_14805, partial [Planctomycetota bacterium]
MSPLIAAAALILVPEPSAVVERAAAAADPTAPLAVWRFGADEDRNFDRWPDGWLRRRGEAFPQFVPLEIDRDAFPAAESEGTNGGALWVSANGAAAAAYSPPVRLIGSPALRLRGRLRTRGLHGGAVVFS